ncbi:UDP-N-acetylmuramoyl-L-alanyl-D-glutamate--2,6-diaminopimelate ligase [Patescibacteria group bacterium]|nr:UDP-N-acetylmuramoyl-L-alanyl-D-glutamate--2,6-diaminopimelate ligase [Patescibacteria group bacterium]
MSLRLQRPQRLINLFWHLPQAILANLWFGYPSRRLKVIGVTGTSGKTTTAHLIHHLLQAVGFKVALISSISAPGLHVTNPEPFTLQKMLKKLVGQGYQYLVLEVTSHGLDQYRNWGIPFTYGVLTNITHEHLDYHRFFNQYRQAKLKLVRLAKIAVLNRDDPSFKLAQAVARGKTLIFTDKPDFLAANVNAATAVALDLGIGRQKIEAALKSFPGIPGRMEVVLEKPFTVVIDFAHKPDALEKALQFLRRRTKGRIIAVFGCAGLRDHLKRPIMGEISGRLADMTILTAEDPRTEEVNQIINEIKTGFNTRKKLYLEPDRQKAINLAIRLAKPGDVVGLFGKAHEKSMCFGTIEYPWSEHQAVKKALKLCNY